MKFATKPTQHYPPHLRHVATLPWERVHRWELFETQCRTCPTILTPCRQTSCNGYELTGP